MHRFGFASQFERFLFRAHLKINSSLMMHNVEFRRVSIYITMDEYNLWPPKEPAGYWEMLQTKMAYYVSILLMESRRGAMYWERVEAGGYPGEMFVEVTHRWVFKKRASDRRP